MVEFCTCCGTSLPKGDLTVKKGHIFTSHDYPCPGCGDLANPDQKAAKETILPTKEKDIVIRKGKAEEE
jgi:hypothetical protein